MSINIDELVDRSDLSFSAGHNYFTKDDLKRLFISGYLSKNNKIDFLNQAEININFNNNKEDQCFRNAAFYFLLRMRYTIWITIDDLVNNPYDQGISDIDYNKYLVIQTIIELYNDTIIQKYFPELDTMSEKRTNFIDTRFDRLKLSGSDKYTKYGVLTELNHFERNKEHLFTMGYINEKQKKMLIDNFERSLHPAYRDTYKLFKHLKGGISTQVITEVIANILSKNVSISKRLNMKNIYKEIIEMKNVYNYHIVDLGSNTNISDFFRKIDSLKSIIIYDHEYFLVGILYDCPSNVAHQIASICYGEDDCIDKNRHLFLDDDQKNIKTLIETDFNKDGFSFSCGETNKPFMVSMLLYEKKNIKNLIDLEINSFIKNIGIGTGIKRIPVLVGGHKQKYLKYKNKYLQLKTQIGGV